MSALLKSCCCTISCDAHLFAPEALAQIQEARFTYLRLLQETADMRTTLELARYTWEQALADALRLAALTDR